MKAARARGETVVFVAATPGRAERLIEVLDDYELRGVNIDRGEDSFAASVLVTTGVLSRGFRLPAAQLQIYAETDLFEEERRAQDRARRSAAKAFLSDLRDLKVGDLVVHVDNGIGEFVGLKEMTVGPNETLEFLELRYAGDDKLFVPVSRLDLIQKYTRRRAARRSTASAARRGRRPRRASRRPCATWPRSCSSSTPRARP